MPRVCTLSQNGYGTRLGNLCLLFQFLTFRNSGCLRREKAPRPFPQLRGAGFRGPRFRVLGLRKGISALSALSNFRAERRPPSICPTNGAVAPSPEVAVHAAPKFPLESSHLWNARVSGRKFPADFPGATLINSDPEKAPRPFPQFRGAGFRVPSFRVLGPRKGISAISTISRCGFSTAETRRARAPKTLKFNPKTKP